MVSEAGAEDALDEGAVLDEGDAPVGDGPQAAPGDDALVGDVLRPSELDQLGEGLADGGASGAELLLELALGGQERARLDLRALDPGLQGRDDLAVPIAHDARGFALHWL